MTKTKVQQFMGIRSDKWTRSKDIMPDKESGGLRSIVNTYNSNFGLKGWDWYILRSKEGYKLSQDKALILKDIEKYETLYTNCAKKQTELKRRVMKWKPKN